MTAGDLYDAVVVGAGPAGAVAGAMLAGRGWRVLVVEKKVWPREKACGGCLNAAAVEMLRAEGLGEWLVDAPALTRMEVHYEGRALAVEIPTGTAVRRREFDAGLMRAAVGRGAEFVTECGASLLGATGEAWRGVRLVRAGEVVAVRGRVVLACDGVRGALLENEPGGRWERAGDSWIGVSGRMCAAGVAAGTIGMFVGDGGYVGVVRLGEGNYHIGAALDPGACHRARGAGLLVGKILEGHGVGGGWEGLGDFVGTQPMTGRRRAVGGYRVLAIGDACGYVEPFTGEGISWAIRGAVAAVKLLERGVEEWAEGLGRAWGERHEEEVGRRQIWCWGLRGVLRHRAAMGACLRAAEWAPWLPAMVARRIGA